MRDLTTAFKNAIAAGTVRIGAIVEIDYPTTPLRAWTGIGNLTWDGKTWLGVGHLGSISAIQEKTGAEAGNVNLTLAGVASEMRAVALANASAGRRTRVWLAVFSEDPQTGIWSVVADPWLPFEGRSDVHKIVAGAIELTVETDLARLRQPKISRYTHEDQQRHYPGDKGLEFAATVDQTPIYWGTAAPLSASAATPGGGDTDSNLP